MSTESAIVTPGAIGARLVQVLEQFLEASSRRDDHMVKLLTVMAKLLAEQSHARVDLAPVVEALDRAAARPTAPDPAPSIDAAASRVATELRATGKKIAAALDDRDDLAAKMAALEARLAAMEARPITPPVEIVPAAEEPAAEPSAEVPAPSAEDLAFLRLSDVFGALPDAILSHILASGSFSEFGPDATIFAEGDTLAAVHIVRSGAVEIGRRGRGTDVLEVMAYLTAGDSTGEMAIFLPGWVHTTTARVPEGASVFQIPREAFMELFRTIPDLAHRLATLFAGQIEGFSRSRNGESARTREIRGSLQYYRLIVLVRNLLAAEDRGGVLEILGASNEVLGTFTIDGGHVRTARMGRLVGEEAFYQLFQSDLASASFVYREGDYPEVADVDARVNTPGDALLYHAATLADEYRELQAVIPDPNATFRPATDALEWGGDRTRPLATEIWEHIERGLSVREILDRVPASYHATYSVLARMIGVRIIVPGAGDASPARTAPAAEKA